MKYMFFCCLWVGGLSVLFAQEPARQVQGYVSEALQGEPLTGAHIQLAEEVALSNAEGYFSVTAPEEGGAYGLICTFVGYDTLKVQLSLPVAAPLQLRMQRSFPQLEEVVVSALRQHVAAPLSSTLVSQKEIEGLYIGEDAPFLLQYSVPSFSVAAQSGTPFGNYMALRLRGMDEARINLTLAGIPLNDMLDYGFYFSNFSDIAESASSIQVQRGIGSSTHGAAAYAGSINIAPPRVFSPARMGFQATGGSFGSLKLSAEGYTGPLPSGLGAYVRISRTHSEGYRDHSGSDAYSFFFSSAYKHKKHLWELLGFSGQTHNDMAYLTVPLDTLMQRPRQNPISENEIDRSSQSLLALRHSFFAGPERVLGYTIYMGRAQNDYPYGYEYEGAYGQTIYDQTNYFLRNLHLGLQLHLQGRLSNGKGGWHLGAQGYTFLRKNQTANLPDKSRLLYDDRSRKTAFEAFLKADQRLGSWHLFADLQMRHISLSMERKEIPASTQESSGPVLPEERSVDVVPPPYYDHNFSSIPTRNWTLFSPKVGLRYLFTPGLSLYSSLGFSQREPTRLDILGNIEINKAALFFAQDKKRPKAEQVWDWELGITQKQGRLQGALNFFYMDFRNEIAPIGEYIPHFYAPLRKNLSKSYRLGLEGSFRMSFTQYLQLSGQGHWMRARIKRYEPEGNPAEENLAYSNVAPGGAPLGQLQLQSDYKLPFWQRRLSFWIRGRYIGVSYLNPIEYNPVNTTNPNATTEVSIKESRYMAPDFFVMDAGLAFRWKYLQLGWQLRNVLDTFYYTMGEIQALSKTRLDNSGGTVRYTSYEPSYFAQAGRHTYLTLRIHMY